MEISDVRRRLLQRIERVRKAAAERRAAMDTAGRDYERFLSQTATPVFLMFASALRAEGYPFETMTPAGSVRLMSEKSGDDFIEIVLDTSGTRPVTLGRSSRARGRRVLTSERAIREGVPIASLTDEDVLEFLLTEIGPFVER